MACLGDGLRVTALSGIGTGEACVGTRRGATNVGKSEGFTASGWLITLPAVAARDTGFARLPQGILCFFVTTTVLCGADEARTEHGADDRAGAMARNSAASDKSTMHTIKRAILPTYNSPTYQLQL